MGCTDKPYREPLIAPAEVLLPWSNESMSSNPSVNGMGGLTGRIVSLQNPCLADGTDASVTGKITGPPWRF